MLKQAKQSVWAWRAQQRCTLARSRLTLWWSSCQERHRALTSYRKCMVEQLEASLLGLVHFNLLHRDDEEGWMLNLSHYDECTDKLFNTIWPTSLNIQSTAVVSQGHCRYILSWSSPLCGSTHVPHTVYAVLHEPMPNNSIHLSVENRAPHIHTHPVNPKTAHVDSQQSQWPSGVCCPELALQPARVPCWFKRQVGWPGNESCLYEAWEHKEWLSGSGRWPRLGQLSSLSAKHNLSFGRVPNTCSPWNLSEPLTKQGTWIKLQ